MHLLIVESNPEIRALLIALSVRAGDSADGVARADEALRALASRHYDAAMIDLRLADGEGVAVLRRLRALGSAMPVAVCAGLADGALRAMMLDDGADVVVERPSCLAEALNRLRALPRRAGAGRGAPTCPRPAAPLCSSFNAAAG